MRFIVLLFLFPSVIFSQNQVLWGLTSGGGNVNHEGMIFNLNITSNTYTNLYNFDYSNGESPSGNLIQAANGLLYGIAGGGANDLGVIFGFNPCTNTYADLYNFAGGNNSGNGPHGSLIQATNGLLYGMTLAGGANNDGVIFSFNPTTNFYTNLYSFASDSSSGGEPFGSLLQAGNGLLYGMAEVGGINELGVLFSFNPATNIYTNLYSFARDSSSGIGPQGSLIQAANGLLYGMVSGGGGGGGGVIFSFNPANNTYTNLYSSIVGSVAPYGNLLQAANGLLYGMTWNGGFNGGGGTIFSFNPSNNTYTYLYGFNGISGDNPYGSLVQAGNGLLYGMTNNGGANGCGCGVIFSFNPDSNTYTDLYSFAAGSNSGSQPFGSLLVLSAGASQITYATLNRTICSGDTAYLGINAYTQTGSYTDTITHAETCDSIVTLNLSVVNGHPAVNITANTDTICSNDSVQLCPSQSFASYLWSTAAGAATTQCIQAKTQGAYSLTVTDNNGCTAQSNNLNIAVVQTPTVTISAAHDSICSGASVQICPNTNFASYTWSNNTHNQCAVATNPGFYSLIVAGTNGCTAQSNSITIYPGHAPIVTISTAGDTICTNDSAQICPTSNFASYRWSDNATVPCLEAKNAGFYSLIATDNNGCTAQSNSLQITVLPSLANLIITANIDTICSGDSANICATAGFSNYIWNNNATGICINAGSTGNYYANAVSSAGCTAQSNQLSITVRPAPSVTISATADSICSNDSAQICAPQGFTIYIWNSNDTGTCIEAHNTGIYYVAVTGNHGCTAQSNSIQIIAIQPVPVTIIASADTVCSGDSINICASAGFSNYIWNNPTGGGATGVCIKAGNTGNYFVNATDSAGCAVQSNPVSITILPPVSISIAASADTICPGDSSNICAPSGFASYAWNPASGEVASNCIEAKSAGNYFVNATNNSGCVAQSNSVTITAVQPAPVSITANPDTICPGDSAHVCAPSGYSTYTWNNNNVTNNCIEAKTAGDYYVTVTDNTGCTVESNHAAITTFQTQQLSISQDADTLIAYGATGVQWYLNDTLILGATQNTYIVHTYGNYTVAVTDAEGCTSVSEPIRVTGIENISDDEYVSVYPNPLSPIAIGGKWQLAIGNKYIGAQIEILDADGRMVYRAEIRSAHSEIDWQFASGVYLMRVTTSAGIVVRKLVRL